MRRYISEIIDHGACLCGHTENILSERIAEIDHEIEQLLEVRKHLAALKDRLPSPATSADETDPWRCESAFIEVGTRQGVRHREASG